MDRLTTAILGVSAGDIVLIATSYFHVTDVREPTHPAASGLVWHGSYWSFDRGHWNAPTLIHMHDGRPFPHVLDQRAREACGWGDLS